MLQKARFRKCPSGSSPTSAGNTKSSNSSTGSSGSPSLQGHANPNHPKTVNKAKKQYNQLSRMAWILGFALMLITAYFAYYGYLETRVITRFDAKRVSLIFISRV